MPASKLDVFWDERVLNHETGEGMWESSASPLLWEQELHPENSIRIRNMKHVLEHGPIADALVWHDGRLAEIPELETIHHPEYIAQIAEICAAGGGRLTSTTVVGPNSWEGLLAAAGTCLAAAEAVISGKTQAAFALVRPPGHHAQPKQADGYCVFSHAALVAHRARNAGFARVAVVDWDVHHGNGTQECFYAQSEVLTVSLHMDHGSWGPSHLQTGAVDELGFGDGMGFNINIAMPLGAGDKFYTTAFAEIAGPILREFAPDFIVCGVGQDASAFDPNGRHNVTMAGFNRLGLQVAELADELCAGRLVLIQEGGYARSYAAYCLHATLEGILGRHSQLTDPIAYVPDDTERVDPTISDLKKHYAPYWKF